MTDDAERAQAFRERLEEVLRIHGWTRSDLARQLGASRSAVQFWFTGPSLPAAEVLLRMPEALGINGHWLLTGEGPRIRPGAPEGEAERMARREVLAEVERMAAELRQRYDGEG